MKIAYCLDNVYDHGGIVQITLTKANILAMLYGYDIYLVVKDHSQEPLIPLEERVSVISLDLGRGKNYFRHWQALYRVLNKVCPDAVVSVGLAERRLLQFLPLTGNPLKIREFHFVRNYMELQAKTTLAKLHVWCSKIFDNITNFLGYARIVVLTEEDRQLHWKGNNKVIVIPNPLTSSPARYADGTAKIVIAGGRLTEQKNFSSLLRIWKKVECFYPEWQLQIWGDGWQEEILKHQIVSLNLNNARLMGHTSTLIDKMSDASIYAMTSIFEGLPLVLIEAMSVGLPIVSYACPCGPVDMISDGKDGYLVQMHDESAFAEKLISLIEDKNKRIEMGANARVKAKEYNINSIMSKWVELFNSKMK